MGDVININNKKVPRNKLERNTEGKLFRIRRTEDNTYLRRPINNLEAIEAVVRVLNKLYNTSNKDKYTIDEIK